MTRGIGLLLSAFTVLVLLSVVKAQDTQGKVDAAAIFKTLDINSDGKLSKDEFLKLAEKFKNKTREKLSVAFKLFDTKMTGLTKDQFSHYLDSVKKKDVTPSSK